MEVQLNLSQFGETQQTPPVAHGSLDRRPSSNEISIKWGGREVKLVTPTFIDREYAAFLAELSESSTRAREFGSKRAVDAYWSSNAQICNMSLRVGQFAPSKPLALFREKYAGLTQMIIDLHHENRNATMGVVRRLSEIFENFFEAKEKCKQYLSIPCPEHLRENNQDNRLRFAALAKEIDEIAKGLMPLSEAIDRFAEDQTVEFRQSLINHQVSQCEEELEQLKADWTSLKADRKLSLAKKGAKAKTLKGKLEEKKRELRYLKMVHSFAETDRLFMQRLHAAIGTEGSFTKNLDWLERYMHSLSSYKDKMSEEDRMRHESFADKYSPAFDPLTCVRLTRSREGAPMRARSASTSKIPFPNAADTAPIPDVVDTAPIPDVVDTAPKREGAPMRARSASTSKIPFPNAADNAPEKRRPYSTTGMLPRIDESWDLGDLEEDVFE